MHLSRMMQNADPYLLSSFRDFYAKVINPNGIQILGTPIATSVSKGRLETDKVSNLCIALWMDAVISVLLLLYMMEQSFSDT